MEYINKMIETYEKDTRKKLTNKQKEAITKILLNSKIKLRSDKK